MIFRDKNGFLSAKLLIILGCVLLLVAGGGVFAYLKFLAPSGTNAAPQPKKAKKTVQSPNIPGPIFDLNPFIVNLAGDSGRRYLKTTIKLELSAEPVKEELTKRMPEIQDNILVLLSSKSYNDIADVSGKIRLRTEIKMRINKILNSDEIKKVYFTEFVIQ